MSFNLIINGFFQTEGLKQSAKGKVYHEGCPKYVVPHKRIEMSICDGESFSNEIDCKESGRSNEHAVAHGARSGGTNKDAIE